LEESESEEEVGLSTLALFGGADAVKKIASTLS